MDKLITIDRSHAIKTKYMFLLSSGIIAFSFFSNSKILRYERWYVGQFEFYSVFTQGVKVN